MLPPLHELPHKRDQSNVIPASCLQAYAGRRSTVAPGCLQWTPAVDASCCSSPSAIFRTISHTHGYAPSACGPCQPSQWQLRLKLQCLLQDPGVPALPNRISQQVGWHGSAAAGMAVDAHFTKQQTFIPGIWVWKYITMQYIFNDPIYPLSLTIHLLMVYSTI